VRGVRPLRMFVRRTLLLLMPLYPTLRRRYLTRWAAFLLHIWSRVMVRTGARRLLDGLSMARTQREELPDAPVARHGYPLGRSLPAERSIIQLFSTGQCWLEADDHVVSLQSVARRPPLAVEEDDLQQRPQPQVNAHAVRRRLG
jgi:hypothetical protein